MVRELDDCLASAGGIQRELLLQYYVVRIRCVLGTCTLRIEATWLVVARSGAVLVSLHGTQVWRSSDCFAECGKEEHRQLRFQVPLCVLGRVYKVVVPGWKQNRQRLES